MATHATITKIDDDKRLVFGWANIIKDVNGRVLLDRQDDFIDDEEELEKAAYEFVLHSRDGGEMHVRRGVSKMVESVVLTPEKQAALGIPAGSVPVGWWVGFKVDDDRVWDQVKKGDYVGFSVHGTGQRQQTLLKDDEFTDIEKGAAMEMCKECGEMVRKGETCKCMSKSDCGCGCADCDGVAVSKSMVAELTKAQKERTDKVAQVMREFKAGTLKTPDGKKVTDRRQALAIAMSEQRAMAKGDYPGHPFRGNQWTGGRGGRGGGGKERKGKGRKGGNKGPGKLSRPLKGGGKKAGSIQDAAQQAATSGTVPEGAVSVKNVDEFLAEFNKVVKQMAADGKEAANFNLCKITVPGTNLFCGRNKGVMRDKMPQIGGKAVPGTKADKLPKNDKGEVDGTPQFIDALTKAGVKTNQTKKLASELKATQNELVGEKVAGMTNNTAFDPGKKPIFISKDGYVLDGHHRWAAVVGRDAGDGKLGDLTMNVIEIDMGIDDLLKFSNDWADEFGIAPKAANPSQ